MAGVVGDWTLDELAGRVAEALAVGDIRAPNGRVTEVPDGRVIRWYATIGLVDRPSAMRGRTALYGPRHLLQLVAIKRLQAQGRSLAEIQADLAGATDLTLRRLAAVPPRLLETGEPAPLADSDRPDARRSDARRSDARRSDARRSADQSTGVAASPRGVAPGPPGAGYAPAPAGATSPAGAPPAGATPPAGTTPPADGSSPAPRRRFWAEAPSPAAAPAATGAAAADRDSVRAMHALALGDGAVLLLPAPVPGQLGPDDVAAIQAAAQPLLDLLAARGRPPHTEDQDDRSEDDRSEDDRSEDDRSDDEPRAEGAHR